MEEVLEIILAMVGSLFIFLVVILLPIYLVLEDEIDSFFEWIKEKTKLFVAKLKPKSPLDKEIAEEEKEIKYLKSQKAKIDRLERLKREKDRLYQEVIKDEKITHPDYYKRTKPLFKTCGLCGNAFVGDHCECLEEKTSTVDPIPYLKKTERYSCPHCGSTKVSSGTRYSITIEGSGVVQVMECSDCGTEIEEEDR